MRYKLAKFSLTCVLTSFIVTLLPQSLFTMPVIVCVAILLCLTVIVLKLAKQNSLAIIFFAVFISFVYLIIYAIINICPMDSYYYKECEFKGIIRQTSGSYIPDTVNVQIDIIEIDGEKCDFKSKIECIYYDKIGGVLKGKGTIIPIENDEYKFYNFGESIYSEIVNTDNIKLVDEITDINTILSDMKNSLVRKINKIFTYETRGIVSAMTIGVDKYLDKELEELYRKSGVSHILVISGMHLNAIYVVASYIILKLTKKKKAKAIFSTILLLLFVVFIGITPSIIRASIGVLLAIIAHLIYRKRDGFTSLGVGAIVVLMINPFYIRSYSFWYSFSAVLGILTGYILVIKPIKKKYYINKIVLSLMQASLVPIFASLGILPVNIMTGNSLSLYTSIINLVAVPAVPFIIVGTYILLIFYSMFGIVLSFIKAPIIMILNSITQIIEFFDKMPLSELYITGIANLIICLLIYFVIIKMLLSKNKKWIIVLLCILILAFTYNHEIKKNTIITTAGIANNPSIILQKNDYTMIICRGSNKDIDKINEAIKLNNIGEIDLVIDTGDEYNTDIIKKGITANIKEITYSKNYFGKKELECGIILSVKSDKDYDKIIINSENNNILFTAGSVTLDENEKFDLFIKGSGSPKNLHTQKIVVNKEKNLPEKGTYNEVIIADNEDKILVSDERIILWRF